MLVVENTSLGLQTTARENLPLSVLSVFGRNFGATVLFTLNCTFALQCNPTWMRDNSGRNYKIAVNCLVCILDYILIQIRKVNGEKGYRFISIVSMTFFLKLRIESFPLCFVCTVSQHIFCCSACSNVLPNVLLLWFVLFFFQCKPWNSSRCWNQLSLMNALQQSPSLQFWTFALLSQITGRRA